MKDVSDVRIETMLPAYLPNEFESSYNARIYAYQRISKIATIDQLQENLNRFNEIYGQLPKELENLCKISLIRYLASNILASKVNIKQTSASIVWEDVSKLNERIIEALSCYSENAVSNMETKPMITLSVAKGESILDLLINFLQFCNE